MRVGGTTDLHQCHSRAETVEKQGRRRQLGYFDYYRIQNDE